MKNDMYLDLNTPAPLDPGARDENTTVVLMNMGGPRTNEDVIPFLYRLFMDPMILRFPKPLQNFFAWLIVTLRGKATKERYQLMGGGSPIYPSTEKQTQALQAELARRGRKIAVTFSFNYSEPLPEATMKELKAGKKAYAMVLSLYPHYSLATTGSNVFYLREAAKKDFPELKFVTSPSYHLHPEYIRAFKDRILEQLKPGESLDDFYLLFSAHGLPLYFILEGDPYAYQISQTISQILGELKRTDLWGISYQSAVGPLKWLRPSTEEILPELSKRGIKKMIIIPISFVTDHIETLVEIDVEYRHVAEKEGISDFRMSKALECHPGLIKALADTVEKALPVNVIARGSHEANSDRLLREKISQ